jgi:hypothetical protein
MGTMIVYFIYCIIGAPIAFLISVILNHYYFLNLLTIFNQCFHCGYAFYLSTSCMQRAFQIRGGKCIVFSTILLTIRLLS